MAKIWTITARFDGGELKRLTFKSEQSFKDTIAQIVKMPNDNMPVAFTGDFSDTIIFYPAKLVMFFCAEVWNSAEGDMAATREIQLASEEFKKQIETRKQLINPFGNA